MGPNLTPAKLKNTSIIGSFVHNRILWENVYFYVISALKLYFYLAGDAVESEDPDGEY